MKEYEKSFKKEFGKSLDQKCLKKLVLQQLKTKEDEFLMNLISHLSVPKLIQLKKDLANGQEKTRYSNS